MHFHPLRRDLVVGAPAAILTAFIAGCATGLSGGPQTLTPPTLAQVEGFIDTLSPELPVFVQELQAAGTLTPDLADAVNQRVAEFQKLVTQLDQLPTGTSPTTLLNAIGLVLSSLLSLTPKSAAFVPLVITLQAVITAYLASQPVKAPNGTPIPVPAPPSATQLGQVHARMLAR